MRKNSSLYIVRRDVIDILIHGAKLANFVTVFEVTLPEILRINRISHDIVNVTARNAAFVTLLSFVASKKFGDHFTLLSCKTLERF